MTDAPSPLCACGHPPEKHVLLSGIRAQCRWWHRIDTYRVVDAWRCKCGRYRPEPAEKN